MFSALDKKLDLKQSRGFSLVELSFVVLISGLILSTLVLASKQMYQAQVVEMEERSLDNAQQLIDSFVGTARYPCPANPNLALNDPNYGREDCSLALESPTNPDVLVGMLPMQVEIPLGSGNFYSIKSAGRLEVIDGNRTIEQISDADMQDGVKNNLLSAWDDYLTYSVTKALTNFVTFNQENGAVTILDEFGGLVTDKAHYSIVSHGENHQIPCDVKLSELEDDGHDEDEAADLLRSSTQAEIENCDGDDVFVSGVKTGKKGDQESDDRIRFSRFGNINYWNVSNAGSILNVRNVDLSGSPTNAALSTRVGVGVTVPKEKMHVKGRVRADRYLRSGRLCSFDDDDPGKTVCILVDRLQNIQCDDAEREYIADIDITSSGGFSIDCQPMQIPEITKQCPTRTFFKGVTSEGEISCNEIPS